MSTRSTITVRDSKDSAEGFSIYRHGDGYPDTPHGVFNTLKEALPYAWPWPRYEAMDFAAAIVAAWKQKGGGNIYFTKGRDAHGDTEYHYEIYQKERNIIVDCYVPGRQVDWYLHNQHILA